jgi:hypothetical protein
LELAAIKVATVSDSHLAVNTGQILTGLRREAALPAVERGMRVAYTPE